MKTVIYIHGKQYMLVLNYWHITNTIFQLLYLQLPLLTRTHSICVITTFKPYYGFILCVIVYPNKMNTHRKMYESVICKVMVCVFVGIMFSYSRNARKE
jgi:hypothetical protein